METFKGKERKRPRNSVEGGVSQSRRESFTKARGKHHFRELKVVRAVGSKIRSEKGQRAVPVSGSLETPKEQFLTNDEAQRQRTVGWRVKES